MTENRFHTRRISVGICRRALDSLFHKKAAPSPFTQVGTDSLPHKENCRVSATTRQPGRDSVRNAVDATFEVAVVLSYQWTNKTRTLFIVFSHSAENNQHPEVEPSASPPRQSSQTNFFGKIRRTQPVGQVVASSPSSSRACFFCPREKLGRRL